MGRSLESATETASLDSVKRPVLFTQLDLDSGAAQFCSLERTVFFGGDPFYGIYNMAQLSPIEETAELSVASVAIEISGIPSDYLDAVRTEPVAGRMARIWFGFLSTAYVLVDDPALVFKGPIDTVDVIDGSVSRVIINIENRFADFDRPRLRRWNNADQRRRYGSDLGFEFAEQTAAREIVWGTVAI